MVFIKDRGKVGYDTRTRVLGDKKKEGRNMWGTQFLFATLPLQSGLP